MSLYASAEGVLYRSYDTFVGNTGLYDGNDDGTDLQYNYSEYPGMIAQVCQNLLHLQYDCEKNSNIQQNKQICSYEIQHRFY
jgi:hypothetical protein